MKFTISTLCGVAWLALGMGSSNYAMANPVFGANAQATAGADSDNMACAPNPVSCATNAAATDNASAGQGNATSNTGFATSADASAIGNASALGEATFDFTYTNTTGTTNDYTFDLAIGSGGIVIDQGPNGGTASGGLDIELQLDGNIVFSFNLAVTNAGAVTGGTTTLTGFNSATNGTVSNAAWAADVYTVSLGSFAHGQTFNLSYFMKATANSSDPIALDSTNLTGTLGLCFGTFLGEVNGNCANSRFQGADPGNLVGRGLTFVPQDIGSNVPEPASLALILTGLAGCAWQRRRHSNGRIAK